MHLGAGFVGNERKTQCNNSLGITTINTGHKKTLGILVVCLH